jgi:hypothetical protein
MHCVLILIKEQYIIVKVFKHMSSTVLPVPSYISHAASATLVTVLGVVYVHRKTSDGGDIYLTRFGLPVASLLEPSNWYEDPWFASKRQRLVGTSAVYRVPTKMVDGVALDLVVKNCRVGEDVPLDTHTLMQFMNTEFNSPWEEFSLVFEMREGRYGPRKISISTQQPLAIYVPPETMQLWQSGRSVDKLNRIHAKHPGIDVDILKQYKLIYQWIRGKDVVETLQDAGITGDAANSVIRPITQKVISDMAKKGFYVADMKPVHIILEEAQVKLFESIPADIADRQNAQGELITGIIETGDYSVVDYELLVRTPEHEEQVTTHKRHTYHDDQRDRWRPTELPSHLGAVEILDVPYIHGPAESTGGHLWVVGRNGRLFDYFLPERWRKTHSWKLSERSDTYYTFTKDHIHIVWKISRVGETVVPQSDDRQSKKAVEYGFNSPFEEFSIAQYLSDKGIPTVYVRAIYMTGSAKTEQSTDRRKYESHSHLVNERGEPLLREDRNYITIRGFFNGTDSWVAGAHELLKPMSLTQAESSGIISGKSVAALRETMIERLIRAGIDGSLLQANDLIVSQDGKGNIVTAENNLPEVRICNFELLRRL